MTPLSCTTYTVFLEVQSKHALLILIVLSVDVICGAYIKAPAGLYIHDSWCREFSLVMTPLFGDVLHIVFAPVVY